MFCIKMARPSRTIEVRGRPLLPIPVYDGVQDLLLTAVSRFLAGVSEYHTQRYERYRDVKEGEQPTPHYSSQNIISQENLPLRIIILKPSTTI